MLTLHRRLIALRRAEPALSVGSYREVEAEGDLLAYVREHAGRRFLVALNLGRAPCELALKGSGRVVLSTHLDREEDVSGKVKLRSDEGIMVSLA